MPIHPTAVIDPQAQIDSSVSVGPYVVIEGPVSIAADSVVGPHVCIAGYTTIGKQCHLYPHSSVGYEPQDLSYDGARTECIIGDHTIVREGVTIHRATGAGNRTIVGAQCMLMANSHVAHNCEVADRVVLANGVLLGGHVHVGTRAFLGGGAVVHQFVQVGELAMLAGLGRITTDVPPFMLAGADNRCLGVNVVGLRRAEFSSRERQEVRDFHRILYRCGLSLGKAIERMSEQVQTAAGQRLIEFLRQPSKRGIIPGRRVKDAALHETSGT
jgi:UDP-N-acetylglucosamine acyltransferase